MVVLITDAPQNGVGKDGDGFAGSPGSSDEVIGASPNAYCPANDPLWLAAQMAERESKGLRGSIGAAGCHDTSQGFVYCLSWRAGISLTSPLYVDEACCSGECYEAVRRYS